MIVNVPECDAPSFGWKLTITFVFAPAAIGPGVEELYAASL